MSPVLHNLYLLATCCLTDGCSRSKYQHLNQKWIASDYKAIFFLSCSSAEGEGVNAASAHESRTRRARVCDCHTIAGETRGGKGESNLLAICQEGRGREEPCVCGVRRDKSGKWENKKTFPLHICVRDSLLFDSSFSSSALVIVVVAFGCTTATALLWNARSQRQNW